MNSFNSEHGQDKYLAESIFKDITRGTFFEAGAIDGLLDSNSLFFERQGWTGLCVEANPAEFEKLKKNRACATEWCALVPDDRSEVEFLVCKDIKGWSAVVEGIEPEHSERIGRCVKDQDVIKVPAMRIDALLKKHGLLKIDYLSLDIEGLEYGVLKSVDWSAFDVRVFDIENNFNRFPIEKYMKEIGYSKINRLGVNDIFTRTPL